MSSIRPLVTIAILIAVGVYFYSKINEAPLQPLPGAAEPWQNAPTADVLPLAATTNAASATTDAAAPPWSASSPAATGTTQMAESGDGSATSSHSVTPTADVATASDTLPAVPAIPELPPVSPTTDTGGQSAQNPPLPAGLPQNIPVATYPDEPGASPAATSTAGSAATLDPYGPPIGTPTTAPSAALQATPTTTQQSSTQGSPVTAVNPTTPQAATPSVSDIAASAPLNATTQSPLPNPLRQTEPTSAPLDPYAPTNASPSQAAQPANAPVEASFAASWPAIQAALDRGDLAHAHQLLSLWHNDPTITPADAARVETLLSQLAGTVVYSTEHQLKPAHVVKPGETLDTIAKQYNVPWQLLAKINGIPAADQLRPGQELKVVPGPFSAVVDLRRSQLTLTVDGRYAGKFPVAVPSGTTVSEGQWLVEQKLAGPSTGVAQSSYTPAASAVERTIVLRSESSANSPSGGPTLTIASGTSAAGAGGASPSIQVSPADAEELSDILSVGSRVVIRR